MDAQESHPSLTAHEMRRIQAFVDRYSVTVHVVGSRAAGTSGPHSDYDYIVAVNSRIRRLARRQLPRARYGGEIGRSGGDAGIDVFDADTTPLDRFRPHITSEPSGG
jgi:hypothetical protein